VKKDIIIIAPHADDEIIGCYEVLLTKRVGHVCFPTQKAIEEAQTSASLFGFVPMRIEDLPKMVTPGDARYTFFAPDHNHDYHPEHRRLGQWAEFQLVRNGFDTYLYNVRMNAPYIREVKSPEDKQRALNTAYPDKADLWAYDHRFFLFEGQVKWVMSWED